MYIAPGLLDQRLTFYTRGEDGADGFQRPVYQATGTFWGRVDAMSSNDVLPGSPQSHMEMRTNLAAIVAEYVDVDPYGVVRVGDDDALYYIRSVYKVRQLRCQQLTLEAIDATAFASFVMYDAVDVSDGTHLVTYNGFTDGFNEGFA
jgi:hypothetical protein